MKKLRKLPPDQRERVREMHSQIKKIRRYLDGQNGGPYNHCSIDRPDMNPAYTELQSLIARAETWSEELVFLIDTEHEPKGMAA